ncbi:MAG: hypothetical protein RQ761_12645 [Bacteroidales bacterium]|nr:hypothetical protein [Bacteroidales bacterium]
MKKLSILSLCIILTHMIFSQDLQWSVLTDTNQLIIGNDVGDPLQWL